MREGYNIIAIDRSAFTAPRYLNWKSELNFLIVNFLSNID
ncbi:hypothetical protein CEV33_4522 [Brucella grignonensis]|uniref:Uncharacterized protein n=1 Tax=Brucella grignonensis TaxID=94627 RepID=A0A256FNT5_9HYPH|nr:hypothetical protein CEV33_4522 [Brucella grignonensis]